MVDTSEIDIAPEMIISRDCDPEYYFPFSETEFLNVVDENGKNLRFGDLYKDQKTIIVFLRHFLCFMSKEYVEDFAKVPKSFLEEAGVRLVLIGCGEAKFIKAFREATRYRHDLYVDPDRAVYKAIGLPDRTKTVIAAKSRHVKSGTVMGILESTWRGLKFCEFQGDMKQQGGSFILGPGNQCHFSHAEQFAADHTAINDLLGMAQVQQVNYPNDTRVMTL